MTRSKTEPVMIIHIIGAIVVRTVISSMLTNLKFDSFY